MFQFQLEIIRQWYNSDQWLERKLFPYNLLTSRYVNRLSQNCCPTSWKNTSVLMCFLCQLLVNFKMAFFRFFFYFFTKISWKFHVFLLIFLLLKRTGTGFLAEKIFFFKRSGSCAWQLYLPYLFLWHYSQNFCYRCQDLCKRFLISLDVCLSVISYFLLFWEGWKV